VKTGRLTTRFLGGRALRFQPDGRLVSLVRDGYETAFEEIFRRYGAALRGYAASIVTAQRADDVTQEAFTKAYLALRGSDKEIQLRPWLYRIVRNTALTNIRDEPKPSLELDEARAAGMSPQELAEQREEISRLMAGLRELPEAQRAAIVMRELEGLSHEQIAASLGLSGGAVRQSIHRARRALREGVGLLVPMPVLRLLLEEGFGQGASAAAAGGGAGIAVKTGVAALLAAGMVTTGTVLKEELNKTPTADAKTVKTSPSRGGREGSGTAVAQVIGSNRSIRESEDDWGRHRGPGSDEGSSGHGSGSSDGRDNSGSDSSGPGPSGSGGSEHSGPGGGDETPSGSSGPGSDGSGSDGSGSGGSGSSATDSSGSGSSGSGSSDSGSSGSGSGGSGSDEPTELDGH
jgi:RNA polymerase sigma factor (sigma-70 family)